MDVTFDPGTCVRIELVMQRHASSIACNKGDYSWFLQSKERMKEASGQCKIEQSGMKNVFCAQCGRTPSLPAL